MSPICIGFLALTLFVAPACQTAQPPSEATSASPLQRVQTGMSPDEVRRTLGPPRRTIDADSTVRWTEYGTSAHRVRIYFDNNRVEALPRLSHRG